MGEYIEREALLRYLNDIWLTATPTDTMPEDDRRLAIVRCMGLNDAMDAVKNAPAADVVPVRHGHWIEIEDGKIGHLRECSSCEEWALFYYGYTAKYCPNCGARMDLKDGDEG